MASSSSPKPRSKPPSLLACISCRRSHLKCDGQKPLCGRCADRDVECVWMESRRGYREFRRTPSSRENTSKPNSPPNQDQFQQRVSSAEPFVLDPTLKIGQANTYDKLFQPSLNNNSELSLQQPEIALMSTPGSEQSRSTISVPRMASSEQGDISGDETTDLIDVFYKYFYRAHPFVVPRKLSLRNSSLLPESLRIVMRFVASHYLPNTNREVLERAAGIIILDSLPEDGFRVQALLLYCIACFARYEQMAGGAALEKAVDIALRIGMNRESFAITQATNNPILQESWRRTWWTLFIIDGLVTAIGGQQQPFRLYGVFNDVLLPMSCEEYDDCQPLSVPRSLNDFENRAFLEDKHNWSSFAYGVEAMYIMGSVFQLGSDTFAISEPQVEAIDTRISNFLLSLPPDKRDITDKGDVIDEVLVLAHMIINWAAILVHRPRSSLTFIRNHYRTICTKPEAAGLPAVSHSSHTSKTLRAANAIISLAAIHRSLVYSTPIMMCGITTAATVHLPAYAIANKKDQAIAIKERLQLGISALGAFAEVWPRADVVRSQVAGFAREVLMRPNVCVDSTVAGPPIAVQPNDTVLRNHTRLLQPQLEAQHQSQSRDNSPSQQQLQLQQQELEYMMSLDDSQWMDSLLRVDLDDLNTVATSMPPSQSSGNLTGAMNQF